MHFRKPAVDRTDRDAMIAFLSTHFRYNTMNHWNRGTSYAHCVKLHNLGLTPNQFEKAYEIIQVNIWDELSECIQEFSFEMDGRYTICSNGRSSGYLVLLKSQYQPTGHQSYCRNCGQRNFKACDPDSSDNKCGSCGASGDNGRVNYPQPPQELRVNSAGIDDDLDFEDWSLEELAERVDVVDAFDRVCDEMRQMFLAMLSHEVVEEIVLVPTKRFVLK